MLYMKNLWQISCEPQFPLKTDIQSVLALPTKKKQPTNQTKPNKKKKKTLCFKKLVLWELFKKLELLR